MTRMRKFGIPTPAVYLIDEVKRQIFMEYMGQQAITVKEFLYQVKDFNQPSMHSFSFDLFSP